MAYPTQLQAQTRQGRIFAVFGPRGGVGCTTIAANLALALRERERAKARVALVDANLMFGDLALVLNTPPTRTIVDLVAELDELSAADAGRVQAALVRHERTGLAVLLAPPHPAQAELVTPEALQVILRLLQEAFDFVVVDTSPSFHEQMLRILDLAERIVLVGTPELPVIYHLRMVLQVAAQLQYPPEKLVLVLNRATADPRLGMEVVEAERILGRRFTATLANDWLLARRAIDTATPLLLTHPVSQLGQDIFALAECLAQSVAVPEPVSTEAPKQRAPRWLTRVWAFA
jgi:pilus assembly protein CpaE